MNKFWILCSVVRGYLKFEDTDCVLKFYGNSWLAPEVDPTLLIRSVKKVPGWSSCVDSGEFEAISRTVSRKAVAEMTEGELKVRCPEFSADFSFDYSKKGRPFFIDSWRQKLPGWSTKVSLAQGELPSSIYHSNLLRLCDKVNKKKKIVVDIAEGMRHKKVGQLGGADLFTVGEHILRITKGEITMEISGDLIDTLFRITKERSWSHFDMLYARTLGGTYLDDERNGEFDSEDDAEYFHYSEPVDKEFSAHTCKSHALSSSSDDIGGFPAKASSLQAKFTHSSNPNSEDWKCYQTSKFRIAAVTFIANFGIPQTYIGTDFKKETLLPSFKKAESNQSAFDLFPTENISVKLFEESTNDFKWSIPWTKPFGYDKSLPIAFSKLEARPRTYLSCKRDKVILHRFRPHMLNLEDDTHTYWECYKMFEKYDKLVSNKLPKPKGNLLGF